MQNRNPNPYPMNRISYPTSGAELETWVEQTIQREIARGRMLQDQKSLSSERSNKVAVHIPKLVNGRNISKWNKRGHARSKSPLMKNARLSSVSRDDSSSSYRSPRLGRPACSMRISELAAPTKRQCMASWRANANVLPAPMINRLKQRVTDQEPIVKVSDAVNCSKHNRRLSDSSNASNSVVITPSKRPSRKINQEATNKKMQAEYKVLSDAFGIKLAELLMKPMVITLNSKLKNLSNIISDEMYNIMKDTDTFKTDKATSKRMVEELSEKVTIWVAQILDDSSEKILEEEMRARELIFAGDMLTLIEIIKYQERELEEQEGPVLDLLDELVNSVLHKCIKTPSDILTPEFLSVTSDDNANDQQETDHQIVDEAASHGDVVSLDEETNKDTIEDDIMKQLNKVIASATRDDSLESPSKVSGVGSTNDEENYEKLDTNSNTDIQTEANIKPELDIKSESDIKVIKPETNTEPEIYIKSESDLKPEPDIDVLYSNDIPLAMPEDDNDDEHNENLSDKSELSSTQLPTNESAEPPLIQNENEVDVKIEDNTLMTPEENTNDVTDTNDEQTSNVSGAIEIINEELSEGKNKTVQFSKENLDLIKDFDKEQNHQINRKNVRLEDEQLLENITYFERPHIDFAPPNEELLSDADESWPETLPITKPSASVTRSITSMGRILESDEVFSTAFEDATEYLLQTTDSKELHENDNDENNRKSILNAEAAGDLRPYHTKEMNDLQSSKELPDGNKTGEPPNKTEEMGDLQSSKESPGSNKTDGPPNKTEEMDDLQSSKKLPDGNKTGEPPNKTEEMVDFKSSKELPGSNKTDGPPNKTEEIDDLQSSKELADGNKIGEPPKGPFTKTSIDNESGMFSVEPLQEGSLTSIRKGASIILIGDENLLDSHLYDQTIWESDIAKHDRSQSSEYLGKAAKKDYINKYQIAEEFISQSHKFDYRVHLKTAPAWIRRGQGEPNGISCACRPLNYSGTDKMKERELEIRKWCQDLDFILMNLDKWKIWLNYISKYITHLKRKAGQVNRSRQRSPQRTVEDISWRQLHKRATCGLKMRRQEETVKLKIPSAPLKYCPKCGRRKPSQYKKRHHQNNIRNNTESKCKRHCGREEASLRKN